MWIFFYNTFSIDCNIKVQFCKDIKSCLSSNYFFESTGGDSAGDTVRAKKSELRLYCDLLMQQVHSVKQSITQKDSEKVWVPDFEVRFY